MILPKAIKKIIYEDGRLFVTIKCSKCGGNWEYFIESLIKLFEDKEFVINLEENNYICSECEN
ncbi:MAG: hypothetical protein AABY07_01235 [Nanoarchaeota archaeon]